MAVIYNQLKYIIRNDDGLVYFDGNIPPTTTTTTTSAPTTTTTTTAPIYKYTCNQYISCGFIHAGDGLSTHSVLTVGHYYKENSSTSLSWLVTAYGAPGGTTYIDTMNHEGC